MPVPRVRSETRQALARLAVAVAAVAALAVAMDVAGRNARRTLPSFRVVPVRTGADALGALQRAGVAGRVLWSYDRQLAIAEVPDAAVRAWLRDPSSGPPGGEESWLYLAMRANLVRRVVYVVPDGRWADYASAARARPELRPFGRGFVQMVDGVPVISVAWRDRASLGREPAVVLVSEATRRFFGDAVADRLVAGSEGGDLVLVAVREGGR